jgi:hypothetical protein
MLVDHGSVCVTGTMGYPCPVAGEHHRVDCSCHATGRPVDADGSTVVSVDVRFSIRHDDNAMVAQFSFDQLMKVLSREHHIYVSKARRILDSASFRASSSAASGRWLIVFREGLPPACNSNCSARSVVILV